MDIFVYRKNGKSIEEGFQTADLPELLADIDNLVWVDLYAQSESDKIQAENVLHDVFKFHPLTIEDAIETRNQPKVESFPDYLFLIMHGVRHDTNVESFVTKELDGYLGRNYVVTYHNEEFRSIEKVKRQIRSNTFICQRGAAYLMHQILDEMVDLYMPIVDDFDQIITNLEDRIFKMRKAGNEILEEIMDVKRSVGRLRRISSKQLQVLYRLSHGEFPLITEQSLPFYRDVHDHLLRISDMAESYRDLVSGLLDIHFSVVANRTNDVMKVLAVFFRYYAAVVFDRRYLRHEF